MSADLNRLIEQRLQEVEENHDWLYKMKALDKAQFPLQTKIEELVRHYPATLAHEKFRNALSLMGIVEGTEAEHRIYEALGKVWHMRVVGKYTKLPSEITVGDIRELRVRNLKKIDGLAETGSFGIAIISRLFDIHLD